MRSTRGGVELSELNKTQADDTAGLKFMKTREVRERYIIRKVSRLEKR